MKDEIIKVIKTKFAITISVLLSGHFLPLKKTFFLKIFKNDMMKKEKLKKNAEGTWYFFLTFQKMFIMKM